MSVIDTFMGSCPLDDFGYKVQCLHVYCDSLVVCGLMGLDRTVANLRFLS